VKQDRIVLEAKLEFKKANFRESLINSMSVLLKDIQECEDIARSTNKKIEYKKEVGMSKNTKSSPEVKGTVIFYEGFCDELNKETEVKHA
tara:strand:+ start:1614 stop:1883 length:270 start_codon:yes stop_codon:yes gene_type:complete